ncbi:hypothetical protein ABEB36_014754 [Hypothenemus hampei]|uniref:THAP-type domain-containing protein n=1 Tax=Hypothenemus hampei TaxID=57062 RepID=A0ABD1E4V4_HYPHA
MGNIKYCCVQFCGYKRTFLGTKKKSTSKPLYRFPNKPQLKEKWVQALINLNGQSEISKLPKEAYICSQHFEPDCLEKIGFSAVRLKPGSIPTIFPFNKTEQLDQDITMASNAISDVPLEITQYPLEEPCFSGKIRYPGDINEENVKGTSNQNLQKYVLILKKACRKKDQMIKRLQSLRNRQKKKINSLQSMLSDLRARDLISSNTSHIMQIFSNATFLQENCFPLPLRGNLTAYGQRYPWRTEGRSH